MIVVPGKRWSQAAVACVAVLGVAACGGDEPEPEPLSAEQYVAEGDALCEDFERENPLPGQPDGSAEETAEHLMREIELREEAVVRLGELEPPDELQAQVEEYRAKNDEVITLTEEMLAAAEANDGPAFNQAGTERAGALEEREQVADEIGFEYCGGASSGREAPDRDSP